MNAEGLGGVALSSVHEATIRINSTQNRSAPNPTIGKTSVSLATIPGDPCCSSCSLVYFLQHPTRMVTKVDYRAARRRLFREDCVIGEGGLRGGFSGPGSMLTRCVEATIVGGKRDRFSLRLGNERYDLAGLRQQVHEEH